MASWLLWCRRANVRTRGLRRSPDEKPACFLNLAGLFWKPGCPPIWRRRRPFGWITKSSFSCGRGLPASSAPVLCPHGFVTLDEGSPRRGWVGSCQAPSASFHSQRGFREAQPCCPQQPQTKLPRWALPTRGARWRLLPGHREQLRFQHQRQDSRKVSTTLW